MNMGEKTFGTGWQASHLTTHFHDARSLSGTNESPFIFGVLFNCLSNCRNGLFTPEKKHGESMTWL
jgi:hypothetical protein